MCGLAGLSMSHEDMTTSAADVAVSLLKGIASRGPDATGAAWFDQKEDSVKLTKVAVPAWRFIEARKHVLPEATPSMLLHTRFATTGSVLKRVNNHPVAHGNIIGVHNGVLRNHKELFKDMKRAQIGEVDSEAIFALLDRSNSDPTVLNQLEGDAAVGWVDLRQPEVLHLANVVGRPLHIAQTNAGTLLFASTKSTLDDAAKQNKLTFEFYEDVPEATYIKVKYGVILEHTPIEGVKKQDAEWSKKYAYTSGTSTTTGKEVVVADKTDQNARLLDLYASYSDADLLKQEEAGSMIASEVINARLLKRAQQNRKEDNAPVAVMPSS